MYDKGRPSDPHKAVLSCRKLIRCGGCCCVASNVTKIENRLRLEIDSMDQKRVGQSIGLRVSLRITAQD